MTYRQESKANLMIKNGQRSAVSLTMIPKENISDALPMRIPACASGLRHMTFPTCVPVMAWPSVTLAALSQSATFTCVISTSSLELAVYISRILLDFKSAKSPSAVSHCTDPNVWSVTKACLYAPSLYHEALLFLVGCRAKLLWSCR